MMSLRILKYIISIIFIVNSVLCVGQSDTLRKSGLRFGYDLSNFAFNYLYDELHEQEIMGDLALTRRLFVAAELGLSTIDLPQKETTNYYYSSFGQFLRVGVDYDMLNKFSNDIIVIGGRFGSCRLNQSIDNFTIENEYWGDYSGSIIDNKINASWFSLNVGLKVEVFANFYLGYTIQGNFLLSKFKDPDITPYYIPGYGKVKEKNSISMNYGIYYLIPFRKL